ncbi:MAG: response regulator, partial [Calditrichaeota bacterium]|nr:response regulator [Calditrichota bacterium]
MSDRNNKVLIVEDNELWSESYKQWIGNHYQIKLASNKSEALETCDTFFPDLIILDLGLPEIKDGLDLLDEIIKKGQDS